MKTKINTNSISHIEIYDFKKTKYQYKEKLILKYFFGLFGEEVLPEGYYHGKQNYTNYNLGFYKSLEIDNFIDKNGFLYEKPKINIFSGKHLIKTKYFESLKEAETFCSKIFPNVNKTI